MNYFTYLAFIIAIVWGISPVLLKFILQKNMPSYLIIFFQACIYLFSSIIYIIVYEHTNIYKDLQKHKEYIPFLMIISFFSVYIANLLYILALENKADVNVMSIIISLAPVITLISSFLILGDTLSIRVLIGFFIILIGLICVFAPL